MYTTRETPDLPLPQCDEEVLHSSTRTSMSTNADADAARPARLTISTTRLELRAFGGELVIRFAEHRVDGLPARGVAKRQMNRRVPR